MLSTLDHSCSSFCVLTPGNCFPRELLLRLRQPFQLHSSSRLFPVKWICTSIRRDHWWVGLTHRKLFVVSVWSAKFFFNNTTFIDNCINFWTFSVYNLNLHMSFSLLNWTVFLLFVSNTTFSPSRYGWEQWSIAILNSNTILRWNLSSYLLIQVNSCKLEQKYNVARFFFFTKLWPARHLAYFTMVPSENSSKYINRVDWLKSSIVSISFGLMVFQTPTRMFGFPLLTILGLFELNVTKFYSSLVNLFQRPSNNMVKLIDLLLGFNFFY